MKTILLALVAMLGVLAFDSSAIADAAPDSKYLTDFLTVQTRRPVAELQPWADAMVDVCQSKLSCLRQASLAVQESHFAPHVVDQSCNDSVWRRTHRVDRICDGGKSYGPWQVMDPKFQGADAAFQASVVAEMMKTRPEAWTTRAAAWNLADAWLAAHP